MILTKKYYKKRQRLTILFCTAAAGIIGSIQTAIIISKIKKE